MATLNMRLSEVKIEQPSHRNVLLDLRDKLQQLNGMRDSVVVRCRAYYMIEQAVRVLVQQGEINKEDEDDICRCLRAEWVSSISGEA